MTDNVDIDVSILFLWVRVDKHAVISRKNTPVNQQNKNTQLYMGKKIGPDPVNVHQSSACVGIIKPKSKSSAFGIQGQYYWPDTDKLQKEQINT